MSGAFEKLSSIFILSAFLLSAAAQSGCSKKPHGQTGAVPELSTEITEDTPWFDIKYVDVTECFDPDEYNSDVQLQIIGSTEDGIFLEFSGLPKSDDDQGSYTIANLYETRLVCYDTDGVFKSSENIDDALDQNFPETVSPFRYINAMTLERDKIRINLTFTDEETFDSRTCSVLLDPSDMTFGELQDETTDILYAYSNSSIETDGYCVQSMNLFDMFANGTSVVRVTAPDGTVTDYLPADFLPEARDAECCSLYLLEDNKVLVEVVANEVTYAVLDLQAQTMSEYTGDTSVFENVESGIGRYIEGIGNLLVSDNFIDLFDITTGTRERYFDYNFCNINRNTTPWVTVEYMTYDKLILSTYSSHNNLYTFDVTNLKIMILDRAAANPNAGKAVIRAAAPNGVTYAVAESICAFNDRSDSSFIIIDDRYDPDTVETDSTLEASSADPVYNRLAIDLFAGDGPDIIFDVSGYTQLCNDDYLMDLSGVTMPDDVYENVIDSAMTGDKIYNIPLLFYPNGLIVNSDDVSAGQNGFTFDQYDEFVDSVCNGTDPTALTRQDFFMACLSLMGSDTSVESDDFWQIAEYARDRYNEPLDAYEEDEFDPWEISMPERQNAYYMRITSFRDLLDGCCGDISGKILLGLPSAEGTAPNIVIGSSVAISARTAYPDVCREFVELLMSNDIQNTFCFTDGNPISRSALEHQITETVESYNDYRETVSSWASPSALEDMGISAEELDVDDCIAMYENMINSCRGINALDSEEVMVIREEIGAYFAGQKTPEEISELISNRIATIQNERS